MSRFTRDKKQCEYICWFISHMTSATDLVCDIDHECPRSNSESAISMKHRTWSQKWNKRWRILWKVWFFVNNIWPTFCFHPMLQCRSGVTFLSLWTSLWAYPCRDGDCVYLGHKTSWGAVFSFTPYTHRSCMKFANFWVTRTQIWCELWSNLLQLLNNIWNANRLMEGWTDGDYTIWPRVKMEHCRRIQYCISMKHWIAQKIGTKYWNK